MPPGIPLTSPMDVHHVFSTKTKKREFSLPLPFPLISSALLERVQFFHQAALTASGIILVDNTFSCCLVESADGCHGCVDSGFLFACFNGPAGFRNVGTRASAVNTIANPFTLTLPVTFNCGFNISQLRSSKASIFPFTTVCILPEGW